METGKSLGKPEKNQQQQQNYGPSHPIRTSPLLSEYK